MKWLVRFFLCLMISFSLVELPITRSQAQAGMISTQSVVDNLTRAQDHQKVVEFMSRSDVQKEMVKLGVKPEDAQRRVASLSNAELKKLATDIEQQTAGGSVTGILVVVLLVILIIYFVKRI